MLSVISPAKTLDFESACPSHRVSECDYLDSADELIAELRRLSRTRLADLMEISPSLAELNYQRYREWSLPLTEDNARAALFAFKGDVYTGLTLDTYSGSDLKFAQKHLRILSGLYGLLRPLDLMFPYRLEMGTALKTKRGKTLYEFWGDRLSEGVNAALAKSGSDVIVNLASQEYFKAISPAKLKGRIVTPHFKEKKNGEYKIVSFFAKKARGMMVDYLIKNAINEPEPMKSFDTDGYRFNPALGDSDNWVFTRG
jgi:cytoplasmic iron level regulating protein YaaA (DUF328/UPF0246 family)